MVGGLQALFRSDSGQRGLGRPGRIGLQSYGDLRFGSEIRGHRPGNQVIVKLKTGAIR